MCKKVVTYGIDNFEKLQNHVLLALDGARLKNFQNGKQSVCANDEILGFCIFPQKRKQVLGNLNEGCFTLFHGKRPDQIFHLFGQSRMSISGNVGLEIHFIPTRVHERKRIVFVFVIAEPRVARDLGKQHQATILGAALAHRFRCRRALRPKYV